MKHHALRLASALAARSPTPLVPLLVLLATAAAGASTAILAARGGVPAPTPTPTSGPTPTPEPFPLAPPLTTPTTSENGEQQQQQQQQQQPPPTTTTEAMTTLATSKEEAVPVPPPPPPPVARRFSSGRFVGGFRASSGGKEGKDDGDENALVPPAAADANKEEKEQEQASSSSTPSPPFPPSPFESYDEKKQQDEEEKEQQATAAAAAAGGGGEEAAAAVSPSSPSSPLPPPPPSLAVASPAPAPSPPLFSRSPPWQQALRPKLKVLAVPLVSGRSHLFVMHAVAAELAARGHEVKMLVVEDDVPAVPSTTFTSPSSSSASTSTSSTPTPSSTPPLEVVPYSSLRDFAWWRSYQEKQASSSPLQDDHAAAWVSASDALLSDAAMMEKLRAWSPDVVVGDTAYLATYGLAAVLGRGGKKEAGEEEKGISSSCSTADADADAVAADVEEAREKLKENGLPFATLSCTGIVDPVHGWLMRFDNDAGAVPQFGSGLRAPMNLLDRFRNRSFKLFATLYFQNAYKKLWRPVMTKHGIPLPGSTAPVATKTTKVSSSSSSPSSSSSTTTTTTSSSVSREIAHVFNASPLLEWERPLPHHVKLVGPILMDFGLGSAGETKKEEEGEKTSSTSTSSSSSSEGNASAGTNAAAAAAAAAASSPSSSSSSSAALLGRKDERAPLPPAVAAAVAEAKKSGGSKKKKLVFVSFGTTVRLGADDARCVASALRSLAGKGVTVVWKLAPGDLGGGLTPESLLAETQGDEKNSNSNSDSNSSSNSSNIIVVPWLPQQSLLASGAVSAFVTHGGMNGLYEAVAAGVPVVGVPFFGDGEDNLEKAASKGVGVTIGRGGLRRRGKGQGVQKEEKKKFWKKKKRRSNISNNNDNDATDPGTGGAGRLLAAVSRVLDEPSFACAAAEMSAALRSRALSTGRLPRHEAADAVELGAWNWYAERLISIEGGEAASAASAAARAFASETFASASDAATTTTAAAAASADAAAPSPLSLPYPPPSAAAARASETCATE